MIGKRYASFQQEWMENINKYFLVREEAPEPQDIVAAPCTSTDKQEQHKLWHKLLLLHLRLSVHWIFINKELCFQPSL